MTPRRAAGPPALFVPLDSGLATPLQRQLYHGVRQAILETRLLPGIRLPSSRSLAAELGVSRNTVVLAFDQLIAEGYLEGRERSGTRVAAALPSRGPRLQAKPAPNPKGTAPRRLLSARGNAIAAGSILSSPGGRFVEPRPFRPGVPALDAFPCRLWTRITLRHWRATPNLAYGDPAGYPPLRRAIAEYVTAARGARCVPEQVIVTSGSQQGLDLAARVLLDPGDQVWMEDPGYLGARAALLAGGAELVPVPVDRDGLRVEEGERLAPGARMAYVSPSHQYPLGATLSAARRLALLRWAAGVDAWVVEDDYDSEFRYASRPLASLQGLDTEGRVVYVGTFSKTLFPALRLGYLVVPSGLTDAFRAARAVADRHSPTLEQMVLADFLDQGHFARHVRRMRALYAERQKVLLAAARDHLGGRLELAPSSAGMHLVGWLGGGEDDQAAAARAARAGIDLHPLSPFWLGYPGRGGLLLGYAGYGTREIKQGIARLASVL